MMMMKKHLKYFIIVAVVILVLFGICEGSFAQTNQAGNNNKAIETQIKALENQIETLKKQLNDQQTQQTSTYNIAVMPIRNAGRIPEVRNGLRVMIVSALQERGISTVESLDRETQQMVEAQRRAMKRGYVDPKQTPQQGKMVGAKYFLAGEVVKYQEDDQRQNLGGLFSDHKINVWLRRSVGSLVVDFRLIDALTGVAVDSFRTEALVEERNIDGAYVKNVKVNARSYEQTLPEKAARECVRQCAEHIQQFINPNGV